MVETPPPHFALLASSEVDQIINLLDEFLVDGLEYDNQPLSGDSAQAQENRAIHIASATLARRRARETRAMLTRVRDNAAEMRLADRATRQLAPNGGISVRSGREVADTLDRSARNLLVRDQENVAPTLDRIVREAMASVPHVRHAGISLVGRGASVTSRSPSDEVAAHLGRLQCESGEGPGVEVIRTGERVAWDVHESTGRWPGFATAALDRDVRSAIAFPLFTSVDTAGALILYADTAHAFDDHALTVGSLYASQAAIALHAARRSAELHAALDARDVVGQATGILIERFAVAEDAARERLLHLSHTSGVQLTELSRWLIDMTTTARDRPNGRPRPPEPGASRTASSPEPPKHDLGRAGPDEDERGRAERLVHHLTQTLHHLGGTNLVEDARRHAHQYANLHAPWSGHGVEPLDHLYARIEILAQRFARSVD